MLIFVAVIIIINIWWFFLRFSLICTHLWWIRIQVKNISTDTFFRIFLSRIFVVRKFCYDYSRSRWYEDVWPSLSNKLLWKFLYSIFIWFYFFYSAFGCLWNYYSWTKTKTLKIKFIMLSVFIFVSFLTVLYACTFRLTQLCIVFCVWIQERLLTLKSS